MIKTIVHILFSVEIETEKFDKEQIEHLAQETVPFAIALRGLSPKEEEYSYHFHKLHDIEIQET